MILTDRGGSKSSRTVLRAFGGLNETYACSEAEYSSGLNFSARNFPALSTRKPRRKLRELADLNGMCHLNGLFAVCGTGISYTPDDGSGEIVLSDAVANSKKQLVAMGTKVIIFPDKLAFDTSDGSLSELGHLWQSNGEKIEFAPCDASGKTYTASGCGTSEPSDPADGQVFLKIESITSPWRYDGTLEIYNAASGNWSAVAPDYCLITAEGLGAGFKQWDTVTVTGAASDVTGQWSDLNSDLIVYAVSENSLTVKLTPSGDSFYGKLTQKGTAVRWSSIDGNSGARYEGEENITVERRVPDLDYLTECENRIWGCSSKDNIIYGCKLGDATNWFSYRSTAADSYSVTVGSDGAFTGAATCMGYALFFKENTLHKLYGSKPSDFRLSALRCRGVAKNAARSLCVLNETLYYLSPEGVMAWDGSLPVKVSSALDASRLANVSSAVGGALDGRYYLCAARAASGGQSEERLLVYDTEKGLWHEEDVCARDMAGTGGRLYFWDGAALWAADPDRESDWQSTEGVEQSVAFELVTGDIGLESADERLLSRLTLRIDAEAAGTVNAAVSYDGGEWESLRTVTVSEKRRAFDIAFVPRRHGTLRLRLSGTGQITLRSIARTFAAAKGGIIQKGD